MTEEKQRFEALPKPIIENSKKIEPNTEEFEEPNRAKALIINLDLSVGDTIKEDGENFIINPKMVLNGTEPKQYKTEIKYFKSLCTPSMIKKMSEKINNKKEDKNSKFYHSFCKKIEKRLTLEKNKEAKDYFSQDYNKVVAGVDNCVYHLLNKENKLNEFVLAWFDKPIPNTQEWREENEGEYIVLTDIEADQRADDYLSDDDYLWKRAVDSGNTTLGFNDWVEMVINTYGRGNILNGYDGCEECEKINETDYYIYRTN